MLFSSFFSSLFSSRRTSSQKFQPCKTTPHRGEQQWPKHLTEADFRAVLAAAVTVAIEEVAAVTVAAEVVAAEVAGEGLKRTRTSGPRARSWGDWCKRYARSRRLRRARFPFLFFSASTLVTGGLIGARHLSRHVAPRTSTRTLCAHQCPFFSSCNSYRVKSNRSSKSPSTPSQSKSTKSSITSSAPTWWMKS